MWKDLNLTNDDLILFATRFIRLFSYGMLSVTLILYLTEIGFSQVNIGTLFTSILIGDIILTLFLTTTADILGRRNILIVGSLLKLFAGIVFAFVYNYYALLIAGTIGIISPTGGEIGPFLSIEQACLTEQVKDNGKVAKIFSLYHACGYISTAFGTFLSGFIIRIMTHHYSFTTLNAYRIILLHYALFGLIKALMYLTLTSKIEVTPLGKSTKEEISTKWYSKKFGLRLYESKITVIKLCCLFIIDSFAGGFVLQTIIVYWFHETFKMDTDKLGIMMMLANVASGISAVCATPLVSKFGAIKTMVITHFPSNIFLLLIPLMPTKLWAITLLLLRFSISQMDVPARQTFVMTSVEADERSAAGGITNLVRSIGLSISPLFVGYSMKDPNKKFLFGLPFIISGLLKCLYDILLFLIFYVKKRRIEITNENSLNNLM